MPNHVHFFSRIKSIKKKEKKDDVDFVVEFLDMEGNSFRVPSMADQNEINMNESSFLHANTEVHKNGTNV